MGTISTIVLNVMLGIQHIMYLIGLNIDIDIDIAKADQSIRIFHHHKLSTQFFNFDIFQSYTQKYKDI